MKVVDFLSKYSDHVLAIDENEKEVKYEDIETFAKELINVFLSRPLVFQICSNTHGSLLGYCGLQRVDAVNLLLPEHISQQQLQHLINVYAPNYLWLPTTFSFNGNVVFRKHNYDLIHLSDVHHDLHPDLSLLLSTSGSTGNSKLVKLSNDNLYSNAESISSYLHIDESERPITSLPMNYSYGLSVINSHIINGATILLCGKSIIERGFWDFFKKYNATSMAGVPYTYEMLSKLRFERYDLPSLRTMTQAGGKLSIDQIKKYNELAKAKGFEFIVMYGQTEATARMSYVPPFMSERKAGSIGIPIPAGKLSIVNDSHESIDAPFVEGELSYCGPNVFGGYADKPTDLETFVQDLPLLTGDIAYKDEDGYFFITGRKKRFVKLFGNRISLDAVEQILKTLVTEVACTGDDSQIRIYVSNTLSEENVKYLAENLHLPIQIFKVIEISEIPKNDSGKTQYSKLK